MKPEPQIQQQPAPASVDPPSSMAEQTPIYQVGQQIMAQGPAVNSTFEVATIVDGGDGNAQVEFPDGSRYAWGSVKIGGIVAPAQPPQPLPTVSPLKPGYDAFKQLIVDLDARCQTMFQMPLDTLVMMVRRVAEKSQVESSGKMDIISGLPMFIPDSSTFDKWVENYLLEVQRREENATIQAE